MLPPAKSHILILRETANNWNQVFKCPKLLGDILFKKYTTGIYIRIIYSNISPNSPVWKGEGEEDFTVAEPDMDYLSELSRVTSAILHDWAYP